MTDEEKKEEKKKKEESDIIELEEPEIKPQVYVKVISMSTIKDVEVIGQAVRNGHVVLAKMKDLLKSLPEYETALQKLKRYANQYGWDIVLLGEEYMLLAPRGIRIER